MNEIFNLHDIPYMSNYLYKKNEEKLREIIETELIESCDKYINLEK